MAQRILLLNGTRAQILARIAAGDMNFREPWKESDGGRSGVGGQANAAVAALADAALSTAGTTTLALMSWAPRHTGLITIAAGSGAYARNIVLPNAVTGIDGVTSVPFILGDVVELRLEVAASANPSVSIYHNAVSGAALLALAGDAGAARNYIATFRHNGTQWLLWDVRQVNA